MRILFLFINLIAFINLSCQENSSIDSSGMSTDYYEDAYGKYTSRGKLKIIPISKYKIIKSYGVMKEGEPGDFVVKYKKATPLVFYEKKMNDSISVKDSIWKMYDQDGKLKRIEFWNEGLNEWTKFYNKQGELSEYDFKDYENDTSFTYTYVGSRLFKKSFFPPNDKNDQIEIYYPEEILSISNAELSFTINFLNKPVDSALIEIRSSQNSTITSISSKHKFVRLADSLGNPLSFPIDLMAGQSRVIKISVSPKSNNYKSQDTIVITSTASRPLNIYSNIYAYHLNNRSLKNVKKFGLSKSKDKYLIIPPMGTFTDATIISSKGKKDFYKINGITQIDLTKYRAGRYSLEVSSCHDYGLLELIISE